MTTEPVNEYHRALTDAADKLEAYHTRPNSRARTIMHWSETVEWLRRLAKEARSHEA